MAWITPIDWLAKAVGYDVTRADLQTISDDLNALYGVPTILSAFDQTGWSGMPDASMSYLVAGHLLTVWIYVSGSSNEDPTTVTLPMVTAVGLPGTAVFAEIMDNGTYGGGQAVLTGNSAIVTFHKDFLGTAFTTSGAKEVHTSFTVPI